MKANVELFEFLFGKRLLRLAARLLFSCWLQLAVPFFLLATIAHHRRLDHPLDTRDLKCPLGQAGCGARGQQGRTTRAARKVVDNIVGLKNGNRIV
jgi:hypothetical protein